MTEININNPKSITSKLLIEELAMRSNLSEKDSKEVFTIIFQIIGEHLKALNHVKVKNFGSFAARINECVLDENSLIKVNFKPSNNLKNLNR